MARWKRKRIALAAVAALLGALVLAAVALVLIINWRLDSRLDAIRAAGDPVTAAELDAYYPEPPPGQNAAPLFLKAFKLLKEPDDEERDALAVVGSAELPEPGQPLPAEMCEAVRSHLEDNVDVLKLLRQAAALGQCKFPLDFSQGTATEAEHLGPLLQAARLFALEAVEHIEGGRPAEAAESLRGTLRCGSALSKEPMLLSGLVRSACGFIAVRHLERLVSRAQAPPDVLRRLEDALQAAAEADPETVERIWIGERCLSILTFQDTLIKAARFPLRYLFKADLAFYLDAMGQSVAAARKPYPGSLIAGARLTTLKAPRYAILSNMLAPAYARAFVEFQRHRARLDSARAALAALRYRAKYGKLPASLDALVPDFLVAVPVDPFSAQRLLLRIEGDGFVVYAVGDNGADDGGKLYVPKNGTHRFDEGFGVRWPYTRIPVEVEEGK